MPGPSNLSVLALPTWRRTCLIATLVTVVSILCTTWLAAGDAFAQANPCGPGLTPVPTRERLLCTHGGDPAAAIDVFTPQLAPGTPSTAGALCPDGGKTGPRIEVIYGVPADRTNRYATMRSTVRASVKDADSFLDASTPGLAGQHYRWLCENGKDVTVRNVTLIPVGSDNAFTYNDMVVSLQNQVAQGLGTVDYTSPDRVYLVFVDQIAGAYPFGGQGDVWPDDTPSPATNGNQTGPHYALINGFDAGAAEHELGHNIGAVQLSAPHSSGAWHCYEEWDEMCYNDGGSYFQAGGVLVFNCSTAPVTLFDCNSDDYYNPQPATGTYLASHWNMSSSRWLTPVSATTTTCEGQPASIQGTPGNDDIKGTDGPDVIVALDGKDEIRGRGGDDRICAGPGRDEVSGDNGNDRIFGEQGKDELDGNRGNDYLDGGPDKDECSGGPGSNTIVNCEKH
jgi:RTX calcium-binding nonapeptide repeat (4 copies)